MGVGICLEMLQFQARRYVIALGSDWLTHLLTHVPTSYWCKITITRSLEGARDDAIPKRPKCTGNVLSVPTSVLTGSGHPLILVTYCKIQSGLKY